MRPLLIALSVAILAACNEQSAPNDPAEIFDARAERPSPCESAPDRCITLCGKEIFVAPPRVDAWPAVTAAVQTRTTTGVFDAPSWFRHEPGQLVNYARSGEPIAAFATGLAHAQVAVTNNHILLSAPAGVTVLSRVEGTLTHSQTWAGVSARAIDRDHVVVEIGSTLVLATVADNGEPLEVACLDLSAGDTFQATSRAALGDRMVVAGGELVERELVNPRLVLFALDVARFGEVLAERPAPSEASVQFIGPDTVEVFASSGGLNVDWVAIVDGESFEDRAEPAGMGQLDPSLPIAPHFVLRRDGTAYDLAQPDAPRAVEIAPRDGDGGGPLACRYDVTEVGGETAQASVLPQHFSGEVFVPAQAPTVECGRIMPGRSVVQSNNGWVLAESAGVYSLVTSDAVIALDSRFSGAGELPVTVGSRMVGLRPLGTDFGMTVETDVFVFDTDAPDAAPRSVRVPGKVFRLRADHRMVWLVSEGTSYIFGERAPLPAGWHVSALDVSLAGDLQLVRYALPPGFEPVDAVPDHLDGAWVFGLDQSILHIAADGEIISQSDIPPRTDATTMTKAANANGLVVADGLEAWWYDVFGIRRQMPGAGVFDVLGADESSYWLMMSAVEGLPAGARGPYVTTRARIEQGPDGVVLLEGDSFNYDEGTPIGFGDLATVSSGGGVVWTGMRAP